MFLVTAAVALSATVSVGFTIAGEVGLRIVAVLAMLAVRGFEINVHATTPMVLAPPPEYVNDPRHGEPLALDAQPYQQYKFPPLQTPWGLQRYGA